MTDQELIEQVAVDVMKWHKKDFQYWLSEPSTATMTKGNAVNQEYFTMFVAPGINPFLMPQGSQFFDPITNANHWMMVVERIRDLKFNIKIEFYLTGMNEIEFYQRQGKSTVICHEEIGKAVCLAALEAVRGSK